MIPLHVVAEVPQQIVLTGGTIALDALLMAAVCIRDRLPPVSVSRAEHGSLPMVQIPIARERDVWLATHARPALVEHERRYKNRRFPVWQSMRLTDMRSVVNISAGQQRSYHLQYTASFVDCGRIEWWCVGDLEEVRDLLALITHVGALRRSGYGRVKRWHVEPCETWDGFPVVRDGRAMRTLPMSWPGVTDGLPGFAILEPPYGDSERWNEEPAWLVG